jgi:hypothetical protein
VTIDVVLVTRSSHALREVYNRRIPCFVRLGERQVTDKGGSPLGDLCGKNHACLVVSSSTSKAFLVVNLELRQQDHSG